MENVKQLSSTQERSRRMKELYAENKIFNHLVLRKNDKGEWYFSLENLNEEEKNYIQKTWCNGF